MPEQNVTTKFKVDISDLKKGISDANKSIKLANAEFKNATAGLDDWSKSADGLTAKIKQQNSIVDAEKKKLDLLKEQLDRLNKSQKDGQKVIDDLNEKYNEAVKEYGAASDEAKKYAKQLSDAQAAQERNAAAAEDLNIKILNQDTNVKNAAAQLGKYETALDDLKNGTENAEGATDKFGKSIDDVNKESKNATQEGLDAFTVALGNLASNVITAVINKLGELGTAVKDAFIEFDEGADNVIKATGATGAAADELTKSYANVSRSIVGDFSNIGDALGEVSTRFGFTGKELEDTTTQFLKFADITGTDAKKAVELVSRAMNNAGIKSENYSEILDQLAKASQTSGISVDKLAETLTKNGATMRQLGFNTDETIAMLAQFEAAGVNSETALAGLKTAVKNWANEGKNANDEFHNVVDAIRNAPDEISGTQAAFDAFGSKAGTELAEAIRTGKFAYDEYLADLAASQGTVNATYEETQDGADKAKLAVQNMKTTAAELVNNFLEKYSPQIEKAIEAVTKTLDKLAPKVEAGIQWLIDNLPLIEAGVVGIATAFAAWKITGIITAVTTALAGMSAAEVVAAAKTWLLNAAMAANPIGLVVTAIAALVAAFVVLWNKSEKFRNFWKGLWKEIKATVEKYIGAVVDFFKNAWERIKAVWTVVTAFFEAIWNGIKAIFEPVIDWFKEKFENAWNAIKAVWLFVHTFFEAIWNNIKAIFEPVIDWFKEKFETAWNTIKAIWTVVTEFFGDIWNGIKETFSSVGDWFSEKFETAVNNIKAVFSVIKNFFSGVWDGIKSVFGGVADWFHDVFSKAWQKVKDVFSTGGKIFTGIKDGIVNAFKTVVNGIIRGINKVIKIPFEKINSMLDIIQGIEVLGVEPFKWLSGRLGIPQIPELAKGGIVKNRSFIAGENGEEAIVPLENNTGGLRKIAQLLSDEMQRSGNVIKGNNSNTVNNYNFNQTNNSPKSLSRYDIYRQTRNLINAAKGV